MDFSSSPTFTYSPTDRDAYIQDLFDIINQLTEENNELKAKLRKYELSTQKQSSASSSVPAPPSVSSTSVPSTSITSAISDILYSASVFVYSFINDCD